ncbi:MAG: nickel pincer cofactor biosynthesis protein LarC [Butyrivibrio sp.]|nr:nickel pincer cofactor biosynthesis protein LarC [Butyrivibrio sp.]
MTTLYIDCGMGAAGDMLTAALLDTLSEEEKKSFLEELSQTGIPKVKFNIEKSIKCGITGTHVNVLVDGVEEDEHMHDHHHHDHEDEHGHHHHHHDHEDEHYHHHHHDHEDEHDHHHHDHEDEHDHHHHHDYDEHEHHHEHHHHHSSMADIENLLSTLNIPEQVRTDVKNIYQIIAQAESHVHNMPLSDIHFHEVGTMDAVADITAVCMLMHKIGPDKVVASPVHVGSGQVRCAHGILPVPAPATAFILSDVPIYSGDIKGELCTPTGAAILKYYVDEFGNMPVMKTGCVGYGMGKKDFERANCVRVMLGEEFEADSSNNELLDKAETVGRNFFDGGDEKIIELRCNIDDMTGEEIGFATEELMSAGAKDAFIIPIFMKKGRPAQLLCVICAVKDRDDIVKTIFKHTSTIGIRETICTRYVLDRSEDYIETPDGNIRVKKVSGYGTERSKLEYEDLARIARKNHQSLRETKENLK